MDGPRVLLKLGFFTKFILLAESVLKSEKNEKKSFCHW